MDHKYALVNYVICKLEASDRTMELSNFVNSSLCSVVLGGSLNQRTFFHLQPLFGGLINDYNFSPWKEKIRRRTNTGETSL